MSIIILATISTTQESK
ncbi:hypothetical protein ACNKHT_27655 [Shigella flexneri]